MSKSEFWFRFRFRSVTFVEIEIPTKFHPNLVEISNSKSDFDIGLDFHIGTLILISVSESEFRFRRRNSEFGTWFRCQFHLAASSLNSSARFVRQNRGKTVQSFMKGAVSRDFRPSLFFIKQYPMSPWFTG
jgi:hypothetical protein